MAGRVAPSRTTVLMVVVLLTFLLVALLIFLQVRANRELTARIEEEEMALARSQAELSRLVKIRDNEPEYRQRLSVLERLIPAKPGEDDLLRHIHNLADDCKVRVVKVSFAGRLEDEQEYVTMPLEIILEGRYQGVLEMLGRIRGGHRALRVDRVQVAGVSPEIRIILSAKAYYKTVDTLD